MDDLSRPHDGAGRRRVYGLAGRKPEDIDNAIRAIHKNGGVVGIAHPFALGDPVNTGYRWEFQIKDWTQVDCLEVWSRNWAPRRIQTERAFAMWDDLLRDTALQP